MAEQVSGIEAEFLTKFGCGLREGSFTSPG
jgi:hypothetical protein